MLLVFAAAGVVAIVAGVAISFVVTSRHHDDTARAFQAAADAQATTTFGSHAIEVGPVATLIVGATPVPLESVQAAVTLEPVTIMFCEPLLEPGGTRVATIETRPATKVVYAPDSCAPDIDADGDVLVSAGDGSTGRAAITWVDASTLNSVVFELFVWTPAEGDLNGVPTIMTGRYLRDASVKNDSLGAPQVLINLTDEGRQVFGSLSERLIGYPLATFVDGQPLRGEQGQILAPTILSRIDESIMITGLSSAQAVQIAALIDNGLAQ